MGKKREFSEVADPFTSEYSKLRNLDWYLLIHQKNWVGTPDSQGLYFTIRTCTMIEADWHKLQASKQDGPPCTLVEGAVTHSTYSDLQVCFTRTVADHIHMLGISPKVNPSTNS